MPKQPKRTSASPSATSAQVAKPTQQKLLGLEVVRLKNLLDVSFDFSDSSLTAIMGANCSGKTTVLHALACSFKPPTPESPSYGFPKFFRPNTDALWKGSNFSINYSQRIGVNQFPDLKIQFSKASDRWTPRSVKRPERYTRFISIGESVPDMEVLNLNQMIHYEKVVPSDDTWNSVREAAGQVLNRVYETLYRVTYAYRGKRSIGVKTPTITYSGLSMSSGEQRVFRVLDEVFRAPDYGLILVDEIDLFLHQDAIQKLLGILQKHCEAKNKQLIFTTHFPAVADMYDKMRVYTINRAPNKTVVWQGYSYEAMRHITGKQDHPISCYVEDDVAEQIIARVASELGIRKFVRIGRYGPAANAFSIASGLYISEVSTASTLVVLDGDKFGSGDERTERLKKVITGDHKLHEDQRNAVARLLSSLKPTNSNDGRFLAPEQVLHSMIRSLGESEVPDDRAELYFLVIETENVPERHGFVNKIIEHTGESREIALSKMIELASRSKEWEAYTQEVRCWLAEKKSELKL
jgi:ABC-type lipoprotein export system ATPase subunit